MRGNVCGVVWGGVMSVAWFGVINCDAVCCGVLKGPVVIYRIDPADNSIQILCN